MTSTAVRPTDLDPAIAANVNTNAVSFPSRKNATAIAPSMNASPTRSRVESRNAPNTVTLPPARARAPSRMSMIEPSANTIEPAQKKSHSLRYSK